MPKNEVTVFACTDIGRRRDDNEDAFMVADLTTGNWGLGPAMLTHAVGERGTLLVVSDGMGGAAAGEIASEMAVRSMYQGMLHHDPDLDNYDSLRKVTEQANEMIYRYAQQHPEMAGMGATLTAALVQGGTAYVAQIGDSRAYLMRGGHALQLTRDQSLIQQLLDSGVITEEQAADLPSNVILQALGVEPAVKVAMTTAQLRPGDCLLLCSDGLSNKVTAEEMRHIVENALTPASACRSLVDLANERGGEDNITVVVARFDGEDMSSAYGQTTQELPRWVA